MGKTIVVIGGGASGLMAAVTAARAGAKVTILEQNNKLGKKILSTGNGRCNMTNLNQDLSNYRSEAPEFVNHVINNFSMENTLIFFHELGILTKEKNGYVYPRSNQAASIVEVLEREVRKLKIKCKTLEEAEAIEKTKNGFLVNTKTWNYECDAVVLACGSKASAIEGSTGSGYELAKNLGHKVNKPLPALVGLKSTGSWFSKWAGVRTDARVTLKVDHKETSFDTGEIQLTDYGISGIPVFQISRFASKALDKNQTVTVEIDFLPEFDEKNVYSLLTYLKETSVNKKMRDWLVGLFPSKLIDVLIKDATDIAALVNNIKHFSVPIKETMDYSHAQICTGGVSCEEINMGTMESKLVPGIYFCGELIDVDGACGGYNLQWAWSSGYLAGKSASLNTL